MWMLWACDLAAPHTLKLVRAQVIVNRTRRVTPGEHPTDMQDDSFAGRRPPGRHDRSTRKGVGGRPPTALTAQAASNPAFPAASARILSM